MRMTRRSPVPRGSGLDLVAITEQLQSDGIAAFARSYEQLLEALAHKRGDAPWGPRAEMRRNFVFTIGHSTRPIDDFVHLLKSHGVQRVVDVRTLPRSRFNPQFDITRLPGLLRAAHIHYTHLPGLGGLRRPRRDSTECRLA